MICPYCSQTHPDEIINCPTTGKKLKRACTNSRCSYYGEYLFPLEQDTCPCCGMSLIDTNNGHKFVDLGLSVKWATCNIGANNPEESGDCFFWGEKAPHDLSPRTNTFEKYYSKRQGTLEIIDDAAHENWGGSWRMPTKEDFEELIDPNNCDIEFTSLNSVPVYKIISKKIGYEDCFIFLPSMAYYKITSYLSSSFQIPHYLPWVLSVHNGYYNFSICGADYDMFLPIRAVCD